MVCNFCEKLCTKYIYILYITRAYYIFITRAHLIDLYLLSTASTAFIVLLVSVPRIVVLFYAFPSTACETISRSINFFRLFKRHI